MPWHKLSVDLFLRALHCLYLLHHVISLLKPALSTTTSTSDMENQSGTYSIDGGYASTAFSCFVWVWYLSEKYCSIWDSQKQNFYTSVGSCIDQENVSIDMDDYQ